MQLLSKKPTRFLPDTLFAWLMVERIGSQLMPQQRPAVMGFFFLMALIFPGVAVARNAGRTRLPMWQGLWRRVSVIADYLMAVLLIAIMVFTAAAVASLLGVNEALSQPGVTRITIGASTLLVLLRLWPFFVLPYMQAPEHDTSDTRSPGFWKKPAISTAWVLARPRGTILRATLPWFVVTTVGILATLVATQTGGPIGRSLVLYPIIIPVLTAYTWALVESRAFSETQ